MLLFFVDPGRQDTEGAMTAGPLRLVPEGGELVDEGDEAGDESAEDARVMTSLFRHDAPRTPSRRGSCVLLPSASPAAPLDLAALAGALGSRLPGPSSSSSASSASSAADQAPPALVAAALASTPTALRRISWLSTTKLVPAWPGPAFFSDFVVRFLRFSFSSSCRALGRLRPRPREGSCGPRRAPR